MSSMNEILALVKSGKLSVDDAGKQLETVAAPSAPFTMKVSEKGAVSMRGVPGAHHLFGLTMYAKTVEFVLDHETQIRAFIKANHEKLSWERAKAAAAA